MSEVITTVIGAFPVLAMAAAIVLVPLLGHAPLGDPPNRPRRRKSGRHLPR